MILKRRVALDGVQLDEVHERVVILGIDQGTPQENISAVSRMGGSGQRMTSQHWNSLDVTVSFGIDVPKTNLALRQEIFDAVKAWALKRGWLTVNWMPDRRMYVDKVIVPNGGDMFEWTNSYDLIFRAYNVPFWQETNATSVAANISTSGTLTLGVGGNVQTVIDLTYKNTSGSTINTFSVNAGGSEISLSSIGLANGATLTISHGTDGLLRIKAGSTSVYNKRAASGADDLYVNPGTVNVSVTAGGAGRLVVSCSGRTI